LALGFLASVVVARSLGPEAFGVYAILGAVAGIAGVLVDPGLTLSGVRSIASVRASDPLLASERARALVWARVALALGGIAAAAVILMLAGVGWLGPRLVPDLVAWTLVGVVATAASGALAAVLQAIGRIRQLSLVLIANSLLTAIFALTMAATGRLNVLSSVIVLGIGTSLVSAILSVRMLPPTMRPTVPAAKVIISEIRSLVRFGRWLWIGDVLALVSGRIDLLIVGRWLDPITLGAYAVALNLASKADVVNHSLITVLVPEAASLAGPGAIRRFLVDGFRRSGLVAILMLLLLPLATPLVDTFYGSGFAAVSSALIALLLVAIFDMLTAPVLLLPFRLDRPRLVAASDIARLGVVVALSFVLVPRFGVGGAVAARFASRLAGAGLVAAGLRWHGQSAVDLVELPGEGRKAQVPVKMLADLPAQSRDIREL
jgi:O-antigen/teichoic acid export membrane protein